MTFTDKRRHRVNWRGKLILQVEIRESFWNGSRWKDYEKCRWIDAKAQHVLEEHKSHDAN